MSDLDGSVIVRELTWEEVVRLQAQFGELEIREHEDIYRGPLEEIRIEGPLVHFTMTWIAIRVSADQGSKSWRRVGERVSFFIKAGHCPLRREEGDVIFDRPVLGQGKLLLRGPCS